MIHKIYLIWRIATLTRQLQNKETAQGERLLELYYTDLMLHEYPKAEVPDA